MKRVLFVDDEPAVLAGLRRVLARRLADWRLEFVTGGEEALAVLAERPVDFLVTDMRMPGMDGVTLLEEVHRRYPHVIRLVLSGHTEMEAALRAVPVAHQFLAKPCDPERLVEALRRAESLQQVLDTPALRRAIGTVRHLPILPETYQGLARVLADVDAPLAAAAALVERDAALCAKMLQVVNSAFFGLPRRVSSVQTAVSLLGVATLKSLVLAMKVFDIVPAGRRLGSYCVRRLQRHCLLVGNVARHLVSSRREAEDAFTAGILHEVGELVLAAELPETLSTVAEAVRDTGKARETIERERFGATHGELGAALLSTWGLPYPIVEATLHHHRPARVDGTDRQMLAAVHVADGLAGETDLGDQVGPPGALDPECVAALGGAERLEDWRALTREQAAVVRALV